MLKHHQMNDLAVTESVVNCQSSYSHWVFLNHSLFVCSLSVQQSHSKWIICHSKHIVLGQVMSCSSFVPAWNLSWIPPLLSSLSRFAPDAPFQMEVSADDSHLGLNGRKTQRRSTEAAAHTGPIRINKGKERANKISVLLLTSVTNKTGQASYTKAADEVMKTLSAGMMSSVMCFYRLLSRAF